MYVCMYVLTCACIFDDIFYDYAYVFDLLCMFAYICAKIDTFVDFSAYLRIFMHIRTYLKKMRGTICYKMNVSRASGTPCGSSYGRFCIFQTFCAKISMSP